MRLAAFLLAVATVAASAPTPDQRADAADARLRLLQGFVAELYCEKHHRTDTGAWCLRGDREYGGQPIADLHYMDAGIGPLLARVFRGCSVLDLGAGSGQYGLHFAAARAGVNYTGVDGALNVERFTNGRVRWEDLTAPILHAESPYDFVMSLEVGEHIPGRLEDAFFANVDANNVCGAALSWAIPGQGGNGHVNCRDNAYVIAKMAALGYAYDAAIADAGRAAAELYWFRDTFMFFRRTRAQHLPQCAAGSVTGGLPV